MTRLRAGRHLLLAACGLGLATTSSAQTEAARWLFTATARETVTDNLFLVPDGRGESISSGTLSLGYFRRGQTSLLSASAWANGQIFGRYRAYNEMMWGAGAFGQHDFDPRLRGRTSLSYSNGLNLEALYSSRVGLPQLDLHTLAGTAELAYQASPDTSVTTAFDATAIRYRSDVLLSSARLPPDQLKPTDAPVPQEPDQPDVPPPPDASLEALGLLAVESVRLSRLDWWTWHTSLRVAQDLSTRTRFDLALGYRQTFEEPRAFGEGEQLEAQAGLRYAIDPTANVSFTYAFQDNRFLPENRVHTFTGQADKEFSSKVKGDVSLGGSYLDAGVPYVSGWTLVGGAGLSARLKHTYLYARYSHSRYQSLLLGRNQDTDSFFGSVGHAVSRRVSVSAHGLYFNARDPNDLYSYETATAGASLSARVGKRVTLGLGYTFRHFQTGRFPAADCSTVSLFVRYRRVSK